MAVINETEPATGATHRRQRHDRHGAAARRSWPRTQTAGDDILRLGFEVHGTIAFDRPNDVDVYSFQGYAGTEVWIAVDRTSFSLDTVLELIDADGNVLARSDNWRDETSSPTTLDRSRPGAIRTCTAPTPATPACTSCLPGPTGQQRTYYIRVQQRRAALPGAEQTSGQYQLQVRLQPVYEHPGSTVRYADIRYATNGIDVSRPSGPLAVDHRRTTPRTRTTPATNDTFATAQPVGNLLQSDQGMINISGYLNGWTTTWTGTSDSPSVRQHHRENRRRDHHGVGVSGDVRHRLCRRPVSARHHPLDLRRDREADSRGDQLGPC